MVTADELDISSELQRAKQKVKDEVDNRMELHLKKVKNSY